MTLGPLDLTGEHFLILYLVLLVLAAIAAVAIPRATCPPGRQAGVIGEIQLAYLAGGTSRFAEVVVARLLGAGALTMTEAGSFTVVSPDVARYEPERRIVDLLSPFKWDTVERALEPQVEQLEQRMIVSGLLMNDREAWRIRIYALLPFAVLLAIGIAKWVVGYLRDRPVDVLTILLIATVVLAAMFARLDRRTKAGRDALARAEKGAGRLKLAPTDPELGLAVALFGTVVLEGSALWDFHRLRSPEKGGADGSGGCSGCGGCGGCGG